MVYHIFNDLYVGENFDHYTMFELIKLNKLMDFNPNEIRTSAEYKIKIQKEKIKTIKKELKNLRKQFLKDDKLKKYIFDTILMYKFIILKRILETEICQFKNDNFELNNVIQFYKLYPDNPNFLNVQKNKIEISYIKQEIIYKLFDRLNVQNVKEKDKINQEISFLRKLIFEKKKNIKNLTINFEYDKILCG